MLNCMGKEIFSLFYVDNASRFSLPNCQFVTNLNFENSFEILISYPKDKILCSSLARRLLNLTNCFSLTLLVMSIRLYLVLTMSTPKMRMAQIVLQTIKDPAATAFQTSMSMASLDAVNRIPDNSSVIVSLIKSTLFPCAGIDNN